MRNLVCYAFMVFSCLLMVVPAWSQQQPSTPSLLNYTAQAYNDENSLPQNSVKGLEMDSKGFLWIATELGLVRFDGRRFLVFNTANTPVLQSDRLSVVKDYQGRIIFADGIRKIYALDDEAQKIIPVNNLVLDNNIRVQFQHIIDLRPSLTGSAAVDTNFLAKMGFHNNFGPLDDSNYLFYQVSNGETYLIRHHNEVDFLKKGVLRELSMISNPGAKAIGFTVDSAFYLLNDKMSFDEYRSGRKSAAKYPLEGPILAEKGFIDFRSDPKVLVFQNDQMELIVINRTLYSLKRQNGAFLSEKLLDNVPEGEFSILKYFPDQAMFVFGSMTRGLMIVRKKDFQALLNINSKKGDEINNQYAQEVLTDGDVLSSSGFIFGENGTVRPGINPAGLGRFAFFKDNAGYLYYSGQKQLIRCRTDFSNKYVYKSDGPIDEARAFAQDPSGAIWFASYEKLYRIRGDEMESVAHLGPDPNYRVVEAIFPVASEKLWIGTRNGLYEYDIHSRQLSVIKSMEHLYVRTIHRTGDGSYWIGTYGQGFYLYRSGKFHKMPTDKWGYLNAAHCFVDDKAGFIWIPTNKGLFKASINDLYAYAADSSIGIYYYYFDRSDGFNTNEFNGGCSPCAVQLPDGTISLPSLQGLVRFKPDETKATFPDKPISVDEIISGRDSISSRSSSLHLKHQFDQLSIQISTAYYGNDKNLKIEYRLSGLSDVWKELQGDMLSYSTLPAGHYELQMRKRNGFGKDNYSYKNISLIIEPRWFETLWFYGLCVLGLTGLFLVVLQLRTRYISIQRNNLEKIVQLRTAELKNSNDLKDKLTSILGHDLKSPLRFIASISASLHAKIPAVPDGSIKEISYDLMKATREVYDFVDEFVLWIKSKRNDFTAKRAPVLVEPIIFELVAFFDQMVKEKENKLITVVEDALVVSTDRLLLKIILRNLLDNANKNTRGGVIALAAARSSEDKVTITVKDNGVGMSAEQIEALSEREGNEQADLSKGMGFKILVDFIGLVGATFSVQSAPGEGTTIMVELPIGHMR